MRTTRPQLMQGYRKHQLLQSQEALAERHFSYPLMMCRMVAEAMAQRVQQSLEMFPYPLLRGDCHSHTVHSDGIGTVAQTAEMARAAGLDFQFVTDHWGVTQAPECRKHELWVGQEPPTQHHHLGVLGLDHAFTPAMDLFKDVAAVKAAGGTPFIPHPTGWWPNVVYSREQEEALFRLPDPFLMEICNGCNNIVSGFDFTSASAVRLWDELLLSGKVVHAMGNTDAHAPHGIGMLWNGVFCGKMDQAAVLRQLKAGHSFVSDGPLVHISSGSAAMGDRAREITSVKMLAVDSGGLSKVRVVADGKVHKTWQLENVSRVEHEWRPRRPLQRYMRMEAWSMDGRRAFSNPIYLR